MPQRRIGLLGGSFNPAHQGHLHVSREALKRLGLDEIWWLVAPQNPLKPSAGMGSLKERIASAMRVARDKRIRILDLESRLGTHFTADTLAELQRRWPRTDFVWLMGADNLAQIRHWKDWPTIFARVPIAVFARPTYCHKALAELAAQRFARARVIRETRRFSEIKPPAWIFLPVKLDFHSATAIRAPKGAALKR
ncbi:MAG TPA: nicotinate-nucleotide adenylyltransferase [Stellaceae bacterium]|nr:nicotinate-nucleotide adenylyltransferase [Stellaceae bacterium]